MRMRTKLTATCALAAVSAVSVVGIPAAHANIADEPIINEFVTDTTGVDMLEYVEVLVPDNYDISDLHVLGIEGDQDNRQGTAVHSYPLGDLAVDEDGLLLLTTPANGLQNAALTIALVDGAVSTGTALDEDLDGVLDAPEGVEILDVVGINDGRSGAMVWGTELSAPSSKPGTPRANQTWASTMKTTNRIQSQRSQIQSRQNLPNPARSVKLTSR